MNKSSGARKPAQPGPRVAIMERLGPQDLMLLWPDDLGWPETIGALAILDGTGLLDPDRRFRVEAVCEVIESRLPLVPRFRQLLYTPRRGLGWPLWVDARSFDLTEHVRVLPLAAPPDEAQLLRTVEQLRALPLDRSRPLWEMWFLPGLADDRVAMFMKVHHTIADGAAGVALLGTFLDSSADAPTMPARSWTPAPEPSSRDLFEDNLRRRVQAAEGALSKLLRPAATLHQAQERWPAVREGFIKERAPQTSFNIPIGRHRRLAVIRGSLDAAKQIAHNHNVKLNDVLMSAVAGGLRELLLGREERIEDLILRAFVPVSLHREAPGQAHGNQDGMMFVPLPMGEADPVRRLQLIAAASAERKRYVVRPPEGVVARNRVLQRAMVRRFARQRWANVYIANIPGPPIPLYLGGSQLLEVFPVVPVSANITLGTAALSYAGQLNITVVADANALPDVEVFAAGLRTSLQALLSFRARADAR
ncbi:wax ester/triacylglycerol synthase family O-acyltransferase [Streptomyces sp.]|uniref:wax ester/triacylglycerol synthase family O-acyltransferase n=1 Tax=Streptomyces sp. TaxID=1931 RepID=UPI002D7A3C2E|nr:wax ester/triacylglycerol synthase family O-acyltransferase [Streptomyces sp.]HET6358047.1 wax ester/triacylglycerol synthase family O-acyltransferase [Streptomyces sp.]